MHFKYTVSDGKLTATANVTVLIRGAERQQGAGDSIPATSRAPGPCRPAATCRFRSLSDWRDFDGDPIGLVGATVTGGTVTTTPDGSLDYIAPGDRRHPDASRTRSPTASPNPVTGKVTVIVQAPTATNAVAAGHPAGHGPRAGRPADHDPPAGQRPARRRPVRPVGEAPTRRRPGQPGRHHGHHRSGVRRGRGHRGRAGRVPPVVPGRVRQRRRSASGAIRVDVVPDPASPPPPVAMPDTAVLHGQQPATVDVLANDFDPSGGVLVVSARGPGRRRRRTCRSPSSAGTGCGSTRQRRHHLGRAAGRRLHHHRRPDQPGHRRGQRHRAAASTRARRRSPPTTTRPCAPATRSPCRCWTTTPTRPARR